jgi:soluble lytic murein transglycosylase-like protein
VAKPAEKTSAPADKEDLAPLKSAETLPELPAALAAPKAPMVYSSKDYSHVMEEAAKRYDVDPDLIKAVVHQESVEDPNAVSGKNAHGLMQLRPSTAKQYGVNNINDPEENVDAGTHYLADLIKRYDGDIPKALAAYNAGPEAVEKYNGVPPFKETQQYVKAIMARIKPKEKE